MKKIAVYSIFFGNLSVLATKGGINVYFREWLPCRGEVIPLKLSENEQEIVSRQFGKYCIEVLRGEELNYLDELDRLWEKEISFSNLREDVREQLCSYDDFPETNYFQVMDMEVPVNGEDISDALRRLPERKRMVILMAYFLDMTEKEIAEALNLVQSTVHYHKADSLKLLKSILKG